MAYVSTGYQRASTVVIDRKISGISQSGYPKSYNILNAFTQAGVVYAVLTSDAYAKLSVTVFNSRLAAFKAHIEELNPGFVLDTTGAYELIP